MSLSVEHVRSAADLSQSDIETWNDMAATPFLRWEWLGSWWESYGTDHQFFVLRVCRDGKPIAFAPWFLEKRLSTGRTIQFLGSGKVCSDHLSIIVNDSDATEVAEALAAWLANAVTDATSDTESVWDSIEFIGVDQTDAPMNCLAQSLASNGLQVEQSEGLGCYVIDLPKTWDEYVQMRSKSGRREIRHSMKNVDSGKISVKTVKCGTELDEFWEHFKSLHQKRRHASGTTGCFDHPPFGDFLRTAASRLCQAGLLEFVIASADGVPVAAQFALVDEDVWYFYQSGMEPDASELRPGLSVFCHAIRETIRSGRKRFDMLRGDEPYKLRWRAELIAAQEIRVCSPRASARLRNQAYNATLSLKNMIKSGLGFSQTPTQ